MRFLIFTIFTLFYCSNILGQNCPSNGITFTTQEAIDSFQLNFSGCETIEGNLIITSPEINNLEGLSSIKSIGGILRIANTQLTNLNGLSALETVRGLSIVENEVLENTVGLENLERIGTSGFFLEENPIIENLNGLSALTIIEGTFLTTLNGLTSFEGLENLSSIEGDFQVFRNNNLSSFAGLQRLEQCGDGLFIKSNESIQSFAGLEQLRSVINGLWIDKNTVLENLDDLVSLQTITSFIRITNNPILETCNNSGICNFLGLSSQTAAIFGNANGCNDEQEITNSCITSSTQTIDNQLDINVFPNPTKDGIFFSGEDLTNARILVTTPSGSSFITQYSNNQSFLELPSANGLFFLRIEKANKTIIRKVLKIE